jgi:mannose-6-phosphate isomerase-like protein (cupin superfamily)
MHVVRFDNAPAYEAPGHMGMAMRRLQGMEAGPSDSVWIGLSVIEPGAGTTSGASDVEKFYVCIDGEVQVAAATTGAATEVAVLKPLDSCRIAPAEARQLTNTGKSPATLLLVMPRRPQS